MFIISLLVNSEMFWYWIMVLCELFLDRVILFILSNVWNVREKVVLYNEVL